jgi:methanogenic corrinoid protein MtbC1
MEQQGYRKLPGPPQQPWRGAEHELPLVGHSDWRRELRKTILSRVVPRLSEIGKEGDAAIAADPPVGPTPDQVVAFADLVLAASVPSLIKYVDGLRSDGLGVDAVLLQLLAPAARHLGDLWLEDKLSFLDVTSGLGRLQGIMRALGPDLEGEQPGIIHGKKVLLAPVSGEQHIFGLSVVAAFFRRAGWDVTFEPRIAFEELLILVRAERFTTIGLSVANDKFAELLPEQIRALRSASLNEHVTILAGGAAFSIDPELQKRIGADAVASDATEAVQMAEALSGQTAPAAPIRGRI